MTLAVIMGDSDILVGRGSGYVTSRPRETSSRVMLDDLLFLLGYPLHFGDALLGGLLPFKCCKRRFGGRVPYWRLPLHGAVGGLMITWDEEDVGAVCTSGAASGSAPDCVVSGGAGACWVEVEFALKEN